MATQLLKTVKPSGGDYTSLEACMNANEQNLVTADKYFDVEIDGDWSGGADTTAVTIHNYTTDATRYINIYTTATARHKGLWSTSYYRLIADNGTNPVIWVASSVVYLTITGIQAQCTHQTNNSGEYNSTYYSGYGGTLNKCILRGGRSPYRVGEGGTHKAYNCVMYGGKGWTASSDQTTTMYNCTFYGNADTVVGVSCGDGTFLLKNCISYNHGATGDYSGTFAAASTNNLSEDATAPALNTYYRNKTLTFVDAANGDFHLVSTDTDAIDLGADLSGTFTDDIDGVTRSGTWDIGADEYVAATSGTTTFSHMTCGKFWGYEA